MIKKIFYKIKFVVISIKYFFKTKTKIAKLIAEKHNYLEELFKGYKDLSDSKIKKLDTSYYYIIICKNEESQRRTKEALKRIEEDMEWSLPQIMLTNESEIKDLISSDDIDELPNMIKDKYNK